MQYVYWVIEGQLAGRQGPWRKPWDPAALYASGIRTIVSLPSDKPVEDLTQYGFEHYRAEFPPVVLTSEGMQKAFLYQALPVWSFLDAQLKAGNPTLVHCYEGNDRTGAILAGYLVTYQGMRPDAAIAKLLEVNPRAMRADGYKDTVRRLAPGMLPDPRTLL